MGYCIKCRQKVEDDARFCPLCGTPCQAEVTQPIEESVSDNIDIEQNKVMAIFSYLGILVFIPILTTKKSKFVRFHANQGLILFIALVGWWLIEYVLVSILNSILWQGMSVWGVYSFFIMILNLVYIIFLVFAIWGIMNVLNAKTKELPIIGKLVILK